MSTPSAAVESVILEAPPVESKVAPLAVGSWALYDFANTIFSLNIVSNYFPNFVKSEGYSDATYAYPMSAALLIVALFMPLLGAMSDRAGRRMPWLVSLTLLCIAMTAVMGLVDDIWLLVGAFVLANIFYQVGLIFYDALLPSVSTTLNWGKVSGLGVGVGYAGALFGSLLVAALIGGGSEQEAFIPTALLFLVFAIPCFLFVKERRAGSEQVRAEPRPSFRGSLTQTVRTIRDARAVPGLFTFLVANFFYSDAINTVIIAMGVFATQVIGFENATSVLAPAIVAAVFGSWIFGFVTDRLTSRRSLIISLLLWVVVFLVMMFVADRFLFQWVIAPLAGVALGSTWTAARTMMIELSPPDRLGEFMGIYNLTGKFAGVLGPFIWGTTLLLLDPAVHGYFAYQVAIGTLLGMVLLGLAVHLRTPDIKRVRAAA